MKPLAPFAALFGVLFLSSPAPAQETAAVGSTPDGARFRIGIAAEGGASIQTSAPSFQSNVGGAFALQLELGVQLNHRVGIVAVPECGLLTGFGCRLGAMADLTFDDGLLSIGAGPEVGGTLFVSSGGDGVDGYTLVGGRGRLALHLLERTEADRPRQRALTIGLDLHLDHASAGTRDGKDDVPSTLVVAPMVTVGYLWF